MGKIPRPASIKVQALQWLAQREHSRDELRGKLLRLLRRSAATAADDGAGPGDVDIDIDIDVDRGAAADPAAEVDTLLVWLEAHGYLSQTRFIESRVHARQSRFGNLRIRQELRQHGVTLDADAQQSLQRSEFDRAREVWRKKYGASADGAPAADAAARMRQMRFLAGRGFSIDVVRRVVNSRAAPGADEPDSPAR